MSFYNGILNHDDIHGSGQIGQRGLPGVGFKLDSNGNYDLENKKLTNVKNGDADHDVMVKSQIEAYIGNKTQYLDGVNPGQVINNKAVIYSPTGSIHSNALYLKDQYGQETIFHNENQDDNQIRLYIPNLKNNDSYGGRPKSSIMVTSIDQTISGRKVFNNIEVPDPTKNEQAVNKGYLDNNFLNRLTGGQIGGDLDMRGHSIKYLKLDKSDSAAARVAELNLKADKQYVDSEISKLPNIESLRYLKRDGSDPMEGDLNLDNYLITNLKDPENDSDAANKGYIDNNMIQTGHPPKNILSYVMDDIDQTTSEYGIEIDKIDNYNDSFHSYNKKVIYWKLLKDGNNYRACIGYNIYNLIDKSKNKFYTAVIEWLTTDNNAWNKMEIFHNITSGSITSNQRRKLENGQGLYYTRSIVQFEVMAISSTPLYLLSTIHIDGVNPTYPAKFTEVFNIIYGINGSHISVSPGVFDYHDTYNIKNGKMTMNVGIDMNNKSLTNLKAPWANSDAVNKRYVDDFVSPVNSAFDIDNTRVKMLKELDMNNKSITNILMSMGGYIFINGVVDQRKYFTIYSNIILRLRQIKIGFIRIHGSSLTSDNSDILKIVDSVGNETRYNFRFPKFSGFAIITIDRYFRNINSIQLQNSTNVGFEIGYSLFR